jgi:hypothetical protein
VATPIVELRHFIQAIRDAGYRGTGSALAELVDNSFEADARSVEIEVRGITADTSVIVVRDDGCGMTPAELGKALQFGGSNRFGQRQGTGRFGMGLPNSSVSQARRVEVYTWTAPQRTWWTYLDVDEILGGKISSIPEPKRRLLPTEFGDALTVSGTVVIWNNCDRLSLKRESSLVRLRREMGRIFRKMLWDGRKISINGETVLPVDPLFLRDGENLKGSKMYGPMLEYFVKGGDQRGKWKSKILVRFAELPVREWMGKSNREKSNEGISKGAGVSVLRAGREIDFGWFFMGGKRKENYDDWWRCEVEFQPELDEHFGVTHTKQGIAPSESLLRLLSPDFETVAHKLNARVRSVFMKEKKKGLPSERRATERDILFAPPQWPRRATSLAVTGGTTVGILYKLAIENLGVPDFYIGGSNRRGLQLVLNGQHPFCDRFYLPLTQARQCDTRSVSKALELLLFAAARAERAFAKEGQRATLADFRTKWSNIVAAFLA